MLGLKNPGNTIDAFLSFFIFSFIVFSLAQMKTILAWQKTAIFIGGSASYFIKSPALAPTIFSAILFGWAVNFVFKNVSKIKNKRVFIILIAFIFNSLVLSPGVRSYLATEPKDGTYRTDMDDFLKTYYLMEKGHTYYNSYAQAIDRNPFKKQAPKDLWSWRLPSVFYLWKSLPGKSGVSIYYLFLALSTVTLFFSFKLSRELLSGKKPQLALIAPYLMSPYFLFASRDSTLLQTEWWSMFLAILGSYLLVINQLKNSALALSLAAVTRSLFIIPITALTAALAFKKKSGWIVFVIPIVLLLLILIIHSSVISQTINQSSLLMTPRIHNLGRQIILATLAFGSWEYSFYWARPFLILYLLSLFGIWKNWSPNKLSLLIFLLFPIAFYLIGSSTFNDYWGIFYIPFIFIAAPLALQYKKS